MEGIFRVNIDRDGAPASPPADASTSVHMSESVLSRVTDCLRRAENAEHRARETADMAARNEYQAIAKGWSLLARNYELAEGLETLLNEPAAQFSSNLADRESRNATAAAEDAAPQCALQSLIEGLPLGVCICGADGAILTYNWHMTAVRGRPPVQGTSLEHYYRGFRLARADGQHIPYDRTPMAVVLRSRESAACEAVADREDGVRLDVIVRAEPLFDRYGRFAGFLNCLQDTTDYRAIARREAAARDELSALRHNESRRELLSREIKHRAKNSLAVVQSIVRHLLRSIPDRDKLSKAVDETFAALASGYDLLAEVERSTVPLDQLINSALAVHALERDRFKIAGPEALIPADHIMTFTLVFHELATNAAKHGALSNEKGKVSITWEIVDGTLHLVWQECGGPPVPPLQRRGFGSVLIESALAKEGQTCRASYPPDGFRWTLDARLCR
jgi:two-component sensor histidine kinase